MIKGIAVRLFPTAEQEQLLWKHVNVSRFVWNYGLALQMERFKNGEKHLNKYALRDVFKSMKRKVEYEWLKEISSHTISNVCWDLEKTYDIFFKTKPHTYSKDKIAKSIRTGKALTFYDLEKHPKFKKKYQCKNAFPVRGDENFYLTNNCAVIEKIGQVIYQTNCELPQGRNVCKFSNPRVKFENNKWILTFGIECENQTPELTDKKMGIDLGIKELAVVTFGDEHIIFKNINKTKRVKTLKRKLRHLQKTASRKYETNNKNKVFEKKWHKSHNILKIEKQIQKTHAKLSNIRRNYIHQTTHKLVAMLPWRITMEDLNVSGMMKNKHLSKAIQEQCLYEFTRQIKYKCEFNGIEFVKADRFYPSSKTCSNCGCIKSDLRLKDRIYVCNDCEFEIDRDVNAAINLMNYSVV